MTFDVDRISLAENFSQALELVLKLKYGGYGTLQVGAGAMKGCLVVDRGCIISAFTLDLVGTDALQVLLNLGNAVFKFIEGDAVYGGHVAEFNLPIKTLLECQMDWQEALKREKERKARKASEFSIAATTEINEDTYLQFLNETVTPAVVAQLSGEGSRSIPADTKSTPISQRSGEMPAVLGPLLGMNDSRAAAIPTAQKPGEMPGSGRPASQPRITAPIPEQMSCELPAVAAPAITAAASVMTQTPLDDAISSAADEVLGRNEIHLQIPDLTETPNSDVDLQDESSILPEVDEVPTMSFGDEPESVKPSIKMETVPPVVIPPIPKLPPQTDVKSPEFADVDGNKWDAMIKSLDRDADTADFSEEGNFVPTGDSLSEQQRILLETVSSLNDPEQFHEPVTPELQQGDAVVLSPEQLEAAKRAHVDEKSFEICEAALPADSGLGEEQRTVLDLYGKFTDAAAFQETDQTLAGQNEATLSAQEREFLESAAQASPEQQKEEFLKADARLDHTELQPKDFVEFQPPESPVHESHLNAPPVPQVLPSDSDPLLDPARKVEKKGHEDLGLINREQADRNQPVARYDGPVPEKSTFAATQVIGVSILVTLCVSLFTIPALIRATSGDGNRLAREQMRQVIEDDLKENVSYEASQLPPGNNSHDSDGGTSGSTPSADGTVGDASLNYARRLNSAGNADGAIASYEKFLELNPENAPVRAELIRVLLARGQKAKARWHCLRGMKTKCRPSEMAAFWELWRQTLP